MLLVFSFSFSFSFSYLHAGIRLGCFCCVVRSFKLLTEHKMGEEAKRTCNAGMLSTCLQLCLCACKYPVPALHKCQISMWHMSLPPHAGTYWARFCRREQLYFQQHIHTSVVELTYLLLPQCTGVSVFLRIPIYACMHVYV